MTSDSSHAELPDTPVVNTGHVSLEGMHGSVAVPSHDAGFWRQWRAFVGPAILISVGYMDPGNWRTDLAGGAQFKYGLLWVVAVASVMAIFMQVISVAPGRGDRQGSRPVLPRFVPALDALAQLGVLRNRHRRLRSGGSAGSAVALNLHVPHPVALGRDHHGTGCVAAPGPPAFRDSHDRSGGALLVATIGVCYFVEIFVIPSTQPSFLEMGRALVTPTFRQVGMVYVAIGMIGATVMPHNLYLHSALVQSRALQKDDASIRRAIRFNAIDSTTALTVAFLVNAAILVLAAVVFYGKTSVTAAGGQVVTFSPDSDWIRIAYLTLAPLLGTSIASTLFVVALLASGQSSTITGTLAGQVVMEGFMHWRVQPWLRRMITRTLAIIPAVLVIGLRGDSSVNDLLTLSQVVLALQLPFAMFPLLHFTCSRRRMGAWRLGWFLIIAGWGSALLITALDVYGLPDSLKSAWHVIVGG